jgi:hypothetical protein
VLEQFSAKGFGLITGHFPWIKSGGVLRTNSRDNFILNLRFCDKVFAERFRVKWRNKLTVVSEEFNKSMKCFWVAVFEGIALWHDLGSLAVHGQPPTTPLIFSSTVALSKSAISCTKLSTHCTQTL